MVLLGSTNLFNMLARIGAYNTQSAKTYALIIQIIGALIHLNLFSVLLGQVFQQKIIIKKWHKLDLEVCSWELH